MTDSKSILKIQAHLDHELPSREAAEIEALLQSDAEARSLYLELKETKKVVSSHEPIYRLAESREFYWSKIERQIAVADEARRPAHTPSWWLKFIAPLAGAAALIALVFTSGNLNMNSVEDDTALVIANPLEETTVFSFHSAEAGMTVVWITH